MDAFSCIQVFEVMVKVVSNGMEKGDVALHQHEYPWISMRRALLPILKQYAHASLVLMQLW